MSIYVTGDTHGAESFDFYSFDGYANRLSEEDFPEQEEMTKNDYVVICGDFGGVWSFYGEKSKKGKEEMWLDWLENRPFTTLFVPGNHENYDRLTGMKEPELLDKCWLYEDFDEKERRKLLEGYPQKDWNGGKVRVLRPSVLMLECGYVFDIDECKCFAFGGAQCHDISGGILKPEDFNDKDDFEEEYRKWWKRGKSFRVKNVSWWEQEVPDEMTMEMGLCNLEDEGNKVDFVFSHTPPASDCIMLGYKPDKVSKYLEKVKQKIDYKKWFSGHLHDNRSFNSKDLLVYEQVIRIH